MKSLSTIYVNSNQFVGPIPESLSALGGSLSILYLQGSYIIYFEFVLCLNVCNYLHCPACVK